MNVLSPLVFRPSLAQRAAALLLFAGSWLVGVRGVVQVVHHLPRLLAMIQLAESGGEPTWRLWVAFGSTVAATAFGGLLLLASILFLLLIEGTQVLVDEIGIAVELGAMPGALARRMGAGRLGWKQIAELQKGRVFFILRGSADPEGSGQPVLAKPPVLRFLVVDQLDRLILMILERSPNLRLEE